MSERVLEAVNGNGSDKVAKGQVAIEGSDEHANFDQNVLPVTPMLTKVLLIDGKNRLQARELYTFYSDRPFLRSTLTQYVKPRTSILYPRP